MRTIRPSVTPTRQFSGPVGRKKRPMKTTSKPRAIPQAPRGRPGGCSIKVCAASTAAQGAEGVAGGRARKGQVGSPAWARPMAPTEPLSYDEIHSIQKRERSTRSLTKVPQDFYERLASYVADAKAGLAEESAKGTSPRLFLLQG